jgi:putative intracellular protease/amidase
MGRHVDDVPVIADGQIITGQAPGSAMLFALVILAHLEGSRTAHNVANGMVADFE